MAMTTTLRQLQLRLLDQTYQHQLHHSGSAFSTLPILFEIFQEKSVDDRLVLSNGHAAASLYIALEEFMGQDSNEYFKNMGDHPKRNRKLNIDCSTGSLGMGITVAVGMALANPNNNVYCVISDGECAEGSVWESLRFAHTRKIENLRIYVNINNFIAYDQIDGSRLESEILCINPAVNIRHTSLFPFDEFGLEAHYMKLSENDYVRIREVLCALPS